MKIMIIGATGTVGGEVRKTLLEQTNFELVLFSRHVKQLSNISKRETVVSGDLTNTKSLEKTLEGVDVIFASLSGDLTLMIKNLVSAMKDTGIKRIIFISSMGIYNEIPVSIGSEGNLTNNSYLKKYRDSADVIENSGLDYTIIRPGWFDWGTDTYEITKKGEPFGGHNVSVPAIADLVKKVITKEIDGSNQSFGINRIE